MVNAQEYINNNYSSKRTDKIDIRNVNLEGRINLSEYTELRDIHLVGCRLNDYTFLKTVPNKDKLIILDLGHNSSSNFQELLWTVSQFTNLEWVSLDGIQAPNNQVRLKPWGYLSKCHTFAVNYNIDLGWEYSLDILQRAYWDNNKNDRFLRWKNDFRLARDLALNEIRLERENEQLKRQNNHHQTQLRDKDRQITTLDQQLNQQQTNHKQLKTEVQNLQTQIQQLNAENKSLQLQLEREKNKNKFLEEQLKEQAISSKSEERATIAEIEIPPKK